MQARPVGAPPGTNTPRAACKEAGWKLRLQPEHRGDNPSDGAQLWWLHSRLPYQVATAMVVLVDNLNY